MLYLHCGWPRTSTSSLQAALADNRDALARVGVLYPEQWQGRGVAHNDRLSDLLDSAIVSSTTFEELERFLAEYSEVDVLLSAEGLTERFRTNRGTRIMFEFVAAARRAAPVRCLWTMRRADDLLTSGYLMTLRQGRGSELPSPADFMSGMAHVGRLFDGMRRLAEIGGMEAVYARYDGTGAHNLALLDALELDAGVRAKVVDALDGRPRRNVSPTHKQAIVLANPGALSRRAGVELEIDMVRETFARGDFAFEPDWRCELVDASVRRSVHERALQAARDVDFEPYLDFFAGEKIGVSAPAVGLDPGIVTDEDLERLVAAIRYGPN